VIRTAFVGLWICAVTIASGYLGTTWQAEKQIDDEKSLIKMATIKVRPVNVPVVRDGKVTGYIVAQFTFIANADTVKHLSVKPDAFLLDAAYKGLYSRAEFDLSRLDKANWSTFAQSVKDQVNARYGSEVLKDVLLEEFGFVPAGTARRTSTLAAPAKSTKSPAAVQ